MPGPDDLKAVNERRLAARAQCTRFLQGRPHRTPREQLEALAAAAGEPTSDFYATGGDVAALEVEVAELLGKPAAAFVPSGTMAQQCALRVWSDRTGHPAVGVHALSHLVVHEEAALEELHGIRMRELADEPRPLVADDLAGHPGPLGALVVELPLRDAGYLLPSWDELVALTGAARERGIPVHLDGARLWESQPFYGRDLAEIAALADTVYVSFYKGLGAPAGAALAGPSDVVDEVRQWRHRHGGTLFSSMPYAVAARAGLRDAARPVRRAAPAGRRACRRDRRPRRRAGDAGPTAHQRLRDLRGRRAAGPARGEHRVRRAPSGSGCWTGPTAASVPGWSKVEFVVEVDHLDWSAEETAALVGQVLDLARRSATGPPPRLHDDEVDIDDALARRLVAQQLPQFAALPVRRVASGGTENAVFRLGDDLALRLPLTPGGVGGLLKEIRWLPVLAPHLTLDVPEVVAVGEPAEDYPFPWAVVRWLPGQDALVAAFSR